MRTWVHDNHAAFERDVLRAFCQAASQLSEQFARFAATGTISFSALRNMIGEPLNKGLLWRLKDKAHHIFLNAGETRPAGLLLDWTLGYIFHETFKLMEDAHQRQFYGPMLGDFQSRNLPEAARDLLRDLNDIQDQTGESMRREAARLARLFCLTRRFFCLYFQGMATHRPLARLLHDRQVLVRSVFQEDYPALIAAVYGNEPERLHIEAGLSLLESARLQEARAAAAQALEVNPQNAAAIELARLVAAGGQAAS